MGRTLVEKIANRFAVGLKPGQQVHALDYISIRPLHVMTHDNTAAVIPKFRSIGASRIFDPRQPVFTLDHEIKNKSEKNLAKYAAIEAFAAEHGIAFHPAGSGIGHQIMAENGYVQPGAFVVASDSHSNLYGALAAVGTPVVRTDAAAIWATGETWWQVPDTARVELVGKLQPGVVGKDVIIALIGVFSHDEVLNCAVEFHGPGVSCLTIEQRMTIANMTTEWGALLGIFPFDKVLHDYLKERAQVFAQRSDAEPAYTTEQVDRWYAQAIQPDRDAYYAKEITLDLSRVTPHVAGPNEVKTITSLHDIAAKHIRIDKAYLLSCVNSRLEDLAQAAEVLRGKRVAAHVKLYVAAASAEVEAQAKQLGYWGDLLAAGAIALPPGCGPCIGLGEGILEAGEVAISATNRNFKGRMGSRDASAYLASPAVVAASAAAGYICGPLEFEPTRLVTSIRENARPKRAAEPMEIFAGFPREVVGRLLYMPKDNMNTDGIYGKDYTYREDMMPEEMARVVMLNYDPQFQQIARDGDIIVGGRNFGSGSSREQAATALKYRGIRMVIAGSFSQTYKRNAFNNAFIVFECPDLVDDLAAEFRDAVQAGKLTIPTDEAARVDFAQGQIEYRGKTYAFAALGRVPQELITAGGTEALIRRRLGS
jgi:homoaconitate hydratase